MRENHFLRKHKLRRPERKKRKNIYNIWKSNQTDPVSMREKSSRHRIHVRSCAWMFAPNILVFALIKVMNKKKIAALAQRFVPHPVCHCRINIAYLFVSYYYGLLLSSWCDGICLFPFIISMFFSQSTSDNAAFICIHIWDVAGLSLHAVFAWMSSTLTQTKVIRAIGHTLCKYLWFFSFIRIDKKRKIHPDWDVSFRGVALSTANENK